MPKAQRILAKKPATRPRNPLAHHPLLGKGSAHQDKGKHASRARLKERLHTLLAETKE